MRENTIREELQHYCFRRILSDVYEALRKILCKYVNFIVYKQITCTCNSVYTIEFLLKHVPWQCYHSYNL